MSKIYMYVVDRDFGFAPNPFHGNCTLATCKPGIRNKAEVGDWVIGMGGIRRLKASGRCIFAMRVTEKITFNEYWINPKYLDKKPVRNGSRKMMIGDNIYQFNAAKNEWDQADSHHSNDDGSTNHDNLRKDTASDNVLISQHFLYFGKSAPYVPNHLLTAIGYKNSRGYRVFEEHIASNIIDWLKSSFRESINEVIDDPFDFKNSERRYSSGNNKII
jgi:Nucleotide modification associated domain 2